MLSLHTSVKKPILDIFNLIKSLKITISFVCETIQWFDNFNTTLIRKTRTKVAVKAIIGRVRRYPLRKQKIMAREIKVPPRYHITIIPYNVSIKKILVLYLICDASDSG